jgi:hypothetical protein
MNDVIPSYTSMSYLSKARWNSYWYQIKEMAGLEGVNRVLEVGIGNAIVSSVLTDMGYDVETLDEDTQTKPDYVCDIRSIPQTVHESFDAVLCCQTLEHIPYKDVPGVLTDFHQVSNKYLVMTLPYTSLGTYKPRIFFNLFPFLPAFQWINCFDVFPKEHPGLLPGGHYWEIGKKDYKLEVILKLFAKTGWLVTKHYPIFENPYHYMIVCQKKV